MLVLPKNSKTTTLRSFWIVFCTITVLLTAEILYLADSIHPAVPLLFLPILIYPVFVMHDKFIPLYNLFNRILYKIRSILQYLALHVIHYIFLISYRIPDRKDSAMIRYPELESLWSDKQNLTGSGNHADSDVIIASGRTGFSPGSFRKWIHQTGKWWMYSIIPFLYIVSLTSDEDKKRDVVHHTYTLY
jgi:hypothetical protein